MLVSLLAIRFLTPGRDPVLTCFFKAEHYAAINYCLPVEKYGYQCMFFNCKFFKDSISF